MPRAAGQGGMTDRGTVALRPFDTAVGNTVGCGLIKKRQKDEKAKEHDLGAGTREKLLISFRKLSVR